MPRLQVFGGSISYLQGFLHAFGATKVALRSTLPIYQVRFDKFFDGFR